MEKLYNLLRERIQSRGFEYVQKSFSNKIFAGDFIKLPEDTESVFLKVHKGSESLIKVQPHTESGDNFLSFNLEYLIDGCFVIYTEDKKQSIISDDIQFKIRYNGFVSHPDGKIIDSGVFKI